MAGSFDHILSGSRFAFPMRSHHPAAVGLDGAFANTVLAHLMDDFQQEGVTLGTTHVRILMRAHMADVYIDDQWIFSSDMKDVPTKGKLGFFVESGKATISNLQVAEVELR